MKCPEVQEWLVLNPASTPMSAEMTSHCEECAECASQLALIRDLEHELTRSVTAPESLVEHTETRMANPRWRRRQVWVRGAINMKKTAVLMPVAGAIAFTAFAFLAPRAEATSPGKTFDKMRDAMAQVHQVSNVVAGAPDKADGQMKIYFFDGKEFKEIEVPESGVLQLPDGGGVVRLFARTGEGGNQIEMAVELDKLPEGMKEQMHSFLSGGRSIEELLKDETIPQELRDHLKQMQEGGNMNWTQIEEDHRIDGNGTDERIRVTKDADGNVEMHGTINGREMTEEELHEAMERVHIGMPHFSFEPSAYQTMAFGGNHHTLLLTPRGGNQARFRVILDPKTNLPRSVQSEMLDQAQWETVQSIPIKYEPKTKYNQ